MGGFDSSTVGGVIRGGYRPVLAEAAAIPYFLSSSLCASATFQCESGTPELPEDALLRSSLVVPVGTRIQACTRKAHDVMQATTTVHDTNVMR